MNTFQFENIDSAFVSDQSLTHIEEALGVEEFTTRTVELSQLAAVIQSVTQNFTEGLVIEQLAQNSNLSNFNRELESFHQVSEVGYRFLKFNFLDSQSLNQLLLT